MANVTHRKSAALLVVALACAVRPACADPTTKLGKWFCTSLENFDADTAFSTFPLRKLGKPVETRRKSGESISVRRRAENGGLAVEYSYQYKQADVDQKYGFGLEVIDTAGDVLDERNTMLWLMEFGRPTRGMIGWQVESEQKSGILPSFSFGMDDSPYLKASASWFREQDAARARPMCRAAKAPPPNAPLPNAIGTGPAEDPRKDPLSIWFCGVLKKDFDFSDAVKKFPLEPMRRDVREQRETKDGVVTISRTAKSDNYAVEYRYSFRTTDVNDPYGFGLLVTYADAIGGSGYEAGLKWLRGFGTPKKDLVGYSVAAVAPKLEGFSPPFAFAFWTTGVRSAQWFSEADISLADKLCKK